MNKTMLVGALAASGAYFLLGKFVIQNESGGGFVPLSAGFGLDDVVLGGGSFVIGLIVAKMVA